jgi:predicted O-methyltransferase YrrM
MKRVKIFGLFFCLFAVIGVLPGQLNAQTLTEKTALDEKVEKFLAAQSGKWHDWNIPMSDGKILYDLIIEGNYKSALEIGTSTGLSGIYIAWALSKTGGKLITIEIDESRHKTALQNFEKAGLADYIDARLADAHSLVKKLEGPFDFVFSDADKNWYVNYFKDVDPKLKVGGCFTAHNISERRSGYQAEYLKYVRSLDNYESTLQPGSSILVSFKKAEK